MSERRPKSIQRIPARRESPSQRITARPPFDPQEFARQSERRTSPPPPEPFVRAGSETPEVVSGQFEDVVFVEETTIPVLAISQEDLAWFDLALPARTLLDHIDGETSVEGICIRAGLPLTEGIDLLGDLARDGIVVCR
ncbi:MAG: hypothetical protein ACREJ3_04310 [Polyangiaceae bacterium]